MNPTMRATIAYCRVSTEEQAEEGYSVEGQADKVRMYASLRELGAVRVIADPGRSGKDMHRPGLQELLARVESGEIAHVVVWRLDRLSRSLADLLMLADLFGQHGVALHSITENLDLSSAAGRMFYNILGTFAQFYREQLSENVRMGNDRAVAEGRYINRPKFGYKLVDGELVVSDDAVMVREVFRLRAEGQSYRSISDMTGLTYSTVESVLRSRVYLGEVPRNGGWLVGHHEPIVTVAEWEAANRGRKRGQHRSREVLSGHVRCGLCGRKMVVAQNGKGSVAFKCRHRGEGCRIAARSSSGLVRATILGLGLLARDRGLQEAIRRHLARADGCTDASPGAGRTRGAGGLLKALSEKRHRLFELHVAGRISQDGFFEEEQRITAQIEALRRESETDEAEAREARRRMERFEEVLERLSEVDFAAVWEAASEPDRRALVDELLESLTVYESYFEVTISGAPPLKVLPQEVGLKGSESDRVGGPT